MTIGVLFIFKKVFKKYLQRIKKGVIYNCPRGQEKEERNMKKLEKIENDLRKEMEQVESNMNYYREMIECTEDVTTREMYENSLTYAKGRWYGLKVALSTIESHK